MYASPVPGTPVYNAPETFPATHGNANAPNKLECDVDIFSYGVILMEVINGSPPVVDPQDHFTKGFYSRDLYFPEFYFLREESSINFQLCYIISKQYYSAFYKPFDKRFPKFV